MEDELSELAIFRIAKALAPHLTARSVMEYAVELEDCVLVAAAARLGLDRHELDPLPPVVIRKKEGLVHMYHLVLECFMHNVTQPGPMNDPSWWAKVNAVGRRGGVPTSGLLINIQPTTFFEHYKPRNEDWVPMADRLHLMARYVPDPVLAAAISSGPSAAKRQAVSSESSAPGARALVPGTGPGSLDFSFPSALRPATLDEYARLHYLYGPKLSGAVHNLRTRTALLAEDLFPSMAIRNPPGTGGGGATASNGLGLGLSLDATDVPSRRGRGRGRGGMSGVGRAPFTQENRYSETKQVVAGDGPSWQGRGKRGRGRGRGARGGRGRGGGHSLVLGTSAPPLSVDIIMRVGSDTDAPAGKGGDSKGDCEEGVGEEEEEEDEEGEPGEDVEEEYEQEEYIEGEGQSEAGVGASLSLDDLGLGAGAGQQGGDDEDEEVDMGGGSAVP